MATEKTRGSTRVVEHASERGSSFHRPKVELFSPSKVDKSCLSYDPVTWSVPAEDDTRRATARHGP